MTRQNDFALWFFGVVSALLLLTSMPATYAIVAPFHSDGSWFGIFLALLTLAAFECGAVGAKLTTIVIPEWRKRLNALTILLLVLTTAANYISAANLFARADLTALPALAWVRTNGAAWLACTVYAALIPLLLFVFLSAFVARWKHETNAASQQDAHDAAIAEALGAVVEVSRAVLARLDAPALPADAPVAQLAAVVTPETTTAPRYTCPKCAAELSQSQYGAATKYGYCKVCKGG